MFKGNKILALIPARGGSKRVPGKNLKPLGSKPLIGWTIEAATQSRYLDRVVLSSEDPDIIHVAEALGCDVPFTRPAALATDQASGMDPVIHALEILGHDYDFIVLLQPTSPLRTAADIDAAIEHCISHNADFCVSVTKSVKQPSWMYHASDETCLIPVFSATSATSGQRGDQTVYVLNGAVYVAHIPTLLREKTFIVADQTLGYIMPEERSLDIDTPFDFTICELIVRNMEGTQ